jgi:predicted O-methyltransferase YrrM
MSLTTCKEVEERLITLGITGYLTIGDIRLLYRLARGIPDGSKILEIGTNRGRSTRALAAAAPECEIITVDIFSLWQGEIPENVAREIGMSHEVAAKFDGPFDLIFIDGDHEAGWVEKDITSWLPKLKVGGIAIFHDYVQADHPGVNEVVDRMIGESAAYQRILPLEDEATTVCYACRKTRDN